MQNHKETKFIIIGAGAAGLTAAETLKEKGYSNIVLIEKESEAGGKCRSAEYNGRSYELGAGIISASNKTIMGLAEKYNIPLSPVGFGSNNLYDTSTGGLSKDTFSLPDKISFFRQLLLRYYRLTQQFPEVQRPGLAECEPELFDNFHQWALLHGIPLVEDKFERFFTGFGYGYWEDIPAAYTLKYNDWPTLVSYIRRAVYIFPEGIQQLWKKIAEQHQVIYNCPVRQIKRNTNGITVESGDKTWNADVLILSCPLDESLHFMEATPLEKELFSRIKYTDYRTYVCRLENFPQQTGFIPANFTPERKGHPVFWYKRYADSDIYTIYVLSDFTVPDEHILQNVNDCVHRLGGQLITIEQVLKWKYFPHVGTKDMQNGYYTKLENMQGKKNTFYIGELLNFSTVELTAAYAKNLAERFF